LIAYCVAMGENIWKIAVVLAISVIISVGDMYPASSWAARNARPTWTPA